MTIKRWEIWIIKVFVTLLRCGITIPHSKAAVRPAPSISLSGTRHGSHASTPARTPRRHLSPLASEETIVVLDSMGPWTHNTAVQEHCQTAPSKTSHNRPLRHPSQPALWNNRQLHFYQKNHNPVCPREAAMETAETNCTVTRHDQTAPSDRTVETSHNVE